MRELPRVSLVVLNWNGREMLEACLASLEKLDYPADRLELVLCDNGSTDGSVEYVEATFGRFRVVALDRNYGFAEGNDRGAAAATGDWVGFLNNDMVVPEGWLRAMVEPLVAQPGLTCIASRIVNSDGSELDFIGGGINFQGHGLQLDHGAPRSRHDVARRVLFPCGGAMLVRRDVFLDVGGFDPDYFAFFEDVDLGWRLNLLGHDTWYTPEATVFHKHHGTAARLPAHQLKLLSERNALFTIFKNYDEDNLALVLPAALMLLNEKALKKAAVNPSDFRPEGAAAPPLQAAREAAVAERGSRAGRLLELTRTQGVTGLARKVGSKGRRALMSAASGDGDAPPPGSPPPGSLVIPTEAFSQLAAISDLAHNMETLLAKRAAIQSRRTRGDDEVLALGRVHLEDPTYGNADYIGFQHWLCEVTGIDRRFAELKL